MAAPLPDAVAAALKAAGSPGAESVVLEALRALHGFLDHWDRVRRTQLANAGGVEATVSAGKAHGETSEELLSLAAAIVRKFAEVIESSPDVKKALGESSVVPILLEMLERHGSSTQPNLSAEPVLTTLGYLSSSPECSSVFVQSGGVARIATLQMLVDPEADFEAGVPRQALMTLSQYCGDSPSLEFSAAVRAESPKLQATLARALQTESSQPAAAKVLWLPADDSERVALAEGPHAPLIFRGMLLGKSGRVPPFKDILSWLATSPDAKERFRSVNGLDPLLTALHQCAGGGASVLLPGISAVCAADDILTPAASSPEDSPSAARDCVRNFLAAISGVRVSAGHPKVVPMCLSALSSLVASDDEARKALAADGGPDKILALLTAAVKQGDEGRTTAQMASTCLESLCAGPESAEAVVAADGIARISAAIANATDSQADAKMLLVSCIYKIGLNTAGGQDVRLRAGVPFIRAAFSHMMYRETAVEDILDLLASDPSRAGECREALAEPVRHELRTGNIDDKTVRACGALYLIELPPALVVGLPPTLSKEGAFKGRKNTDHGEMANFAQKQGLATAAAAAALLRAADDGLADDAITGLTLVIGWGGSLTISTYAKSGVVAAVAQRLSSGLEGPLAPKAAEALATFVDGYLALDTDARALSLSAMREQPALVSALSSVVREAAAPEQIAVRACAGHLLQIILEGWDDGKDLRTELSLQLDVSSLAWHLYSPDCAAHLKDIVSYLNRLEKGVRDVKNKMVLDRNKGNVPTGPADVIGHVGGGAALQEALSWAHEPKVALSSARVFLANLGTVAPPTRKNTDKLLAAAAGSALLDQQLLQLPIVNGVTQAALNLIMTQWDTKEGTWFCVTAAAGLGAKLVTVLKTVTDNPPFVAQVCTLICRLAEPSQQIGYRMALDKQGALPLLLARIETGGLDGGAQSELCGAAAAFAAMVSSCSQINASALKAEAVEKITKRLRDLSAPGVATTDAALHSLIACLLAMAECEPAHEKLVAVDSAAACVAAATREEAGDETTRMAARMLFASAFHGEGLEEADAAIAAAGGKGATAKHPAAILAEALTRADAPEDPNEAWSDSDLVPCNYGARTALLRAMISRDPGALPAVTAFVGVHRAAERLAHVVVTERGESGDARVHALVVLAALAERGPDDVFSTAGTLSAVREAARIGSRNSFDKTMKMAGQCLLEALEKFQELEVLPEGALTNPLFANDSIPENHVAIPSGFEMKGNLRGMVKSKPPPKQTPVAKAIAAAEQRKAAAAGGEGSAPPSPAPGTPGPPLGSGSTPSLANSAAPSPRPPPRTPSGLGQPPLPSPRPPLPTLSIGAMSVASTSSAGTARPPSALRPNSGSPSAPASPQAAASPSPIPSAAAGVGGTVNGNSHILVDQGEILSEMAKLREMLATIQEFQQTLGKQLTAVLTNGTVGSRGDSELSDGAKRRQTSKAHKQASKNAAFKSARLGIPGLEQGDELIHCICVWPRWLNWLRRKKKRSVAPSDASSG